MGCASSSLAHDERRSRKKKKSSGRTSPPRRPSSPKRQPSPTKDPSGSRGSVSRGKLRAGPAGKLGSAVCPVCPVHFIAHQLLVLSSQQLDMCPCAEKSLQRLLSANTGAVFRLGPEAQKGVETRLRRLSAPLIPAGSSSQEVGWFPPTSVVVVPAVQALGGWLGATCVEQSCRKTEGRRVLGTVKSEAQLGH